MNNLIKFMDMGFIIWSKEDKFVVQKVSTNKNPSCFLYEQESIKEFDSFETAVDFCEKFISESESNLRICKVQMAYNSTGYASKIVCLDDIKASSPSDANEKAKKMAIKYLKSNDLFDKVGDNFELKVVPI